MKHLIYTREGIPPDQQRLVFENEPLGNGCTLSDYNIQDGAELDLLHFLRGGMFHETSSREDFSALAAEIWSFDIVRCHPSTGAVTTERLTLPRGTLFADFLDTIRAMPLPKLPASAKKKPIATVAAVSSFHASDGDCIVAPVAAASAEAGDDVGVLERQIATLKRKLDDTKEAAAAADGASGAAEESAAAASSAAHSSAAASTTAS